MSSGGTVAHLLPLQQFVSIAVAPIVVSFYLPSSFTSFLHLFSFLLLSCSIPGLLFFVLLSLHLLIVIFLHSYVSSHSLRRLISVSLCRSASVLLVFLRFVQAPGTSVSSLLFLHIFGDLSNRGDRLTSSTQSDTDTF